jgi:hypothetical protein
VELRLVELGRSPRPRPRGLVPDVGLRGGDLLGEVQAVEARPGLAASSSMSNLPSGAWR